MRSRSNSAFSLIEVLIAIAILSTAIVFVFRSFTAALTATRLGQNITVACFLAEDKIWEIGEAVKGGVDFDESGSVKLNERKFEWKAKIDRFGAGELRTLDFGVEWPESSKGRKYSLSFITYILKPDST